MFECEQSGKPDPRGHSTKKTATKKVIICCVVVASQVLLPTDGKNRGVNLGTRNVGKPSTPKAALDERIHNSLGVGVNIVMSTSLQHPYRGSTIVMKIITSAISASLYIGISVLCICFLRAPASPVLQIHLGRKTTGALSSLCPCVVALEFLQPTITMLAPVIF